ncbi:hypothetical protein B0H10DRAFT_2429932 [Mycena sp. CBHHK59/15]|nr:hypothetical protein B0H10DRAFT_2429932 [Mycena sp. CBHHK59/15]
MPIITIFGATGTQGSSVLNAVLADGKYTARPVTRNPESESSKALIAKGVKVVKGDLFDKNSVKDAIKGSDVVFGTTNFWDPTIFPADHTGKGEIEQGKNLVDAAKEVGVKFFIWSSLPNATKESNGKYSHVCHFDNKAVIEEYLKASGVPYASLLTAWFADNLWNFGVLEKTDTGYRIPVAKYRPNDTQSITWVAHDLGQSAVALLNNYTDPAKGVLGRAFPVVTARISYPALADKISRAIGKEVVFTPLESAGMTELDDMFEFQANIGMYTSTPVPSPDLVALGVKMGTVDELIETEVVPRFA